MDYGYGYGDYGLTSGQSAAVGAFTGIFLIFFLVMMAICITCAVLVIIGQWKIFKKGNQPEKEEADDDSDILPNE